MHSTVLFTPKDLAEARQPPRWYGEVQIRSYSHIISQEFVQVWNELDNAIKLQKLSKRLLRVGFILPELKDDNELYIRSTMMSVIFVVPLNVGTFGHFWWDPPAWPFRFSKLFDLKGNHDVQVRVSIEDKTQWNHRPLTRDDVLMVRKIYAGLGMLNEAYFKLYSLATTFLGAHSIESEFYTEAFSNFYRLIERFVKVELLKKKKGKLKVWQIQKALMSLGVEESIVAVLDDLAETRSRDTMHALGVEKLVTFEEAGKCKLLCDYMLHKYADKCLKELADQ